MFRGIKNIFIILLIGVLASGIPIYINRININALIPDAISDRNVVAVTTEQNVISSDHVQIKLGFSPKTKKNYFNFFFEESDPFTVELLSNNEQISNLPPDKLISSNNYKAMEFYNNDVQYVTFEFEQKKLDLPDGSYNLKIIPNIKDKKIDIADHEFHINFNTDGSYVQAIPSVKSGEMALTLYFPDNEFNHLIPITRVVRANTYPLTTTIRNIEQGPDESLGLPTISPIPIGSSAGRVGDTVHVRLPRNISEFDHGSTKATTAINSFVRSLTSSSGVSKVQFRLTGQYSNDPFHGIDMNEPFFPTNKPEIYTAYITDTDRFLLVPIPLDIFGDRYNSGDIETIFNLMKFKALPKVYNAKRHPIVPSNIELLDYSINNKKLTLIFNEDFIKTYEHNPNRHVMMVDGIVFTFMSLENIDSVNIKIEPDSTGSSRRQLLNYDFTMPTHINPEKEQPPELNLGYLPK
ncbi:MAG: GerMN domain-containing protein [Candidatus Alkaliphilus sp. MAG34]|nr:GerMN domain-containing protein [Clostridiales bacterium]